MLSVGVARSTHNTKKWDDPSGSGTLPDEKIRAELDLQNQQYLAAAQQVIAIAEDAQLATSLEKVAQSAQDEAQAMEMATLAASSLGRGHADLGREFPHVSYAVQDFTSLNGIQGLGRSGNVSKVQRGESESEGTAAQEAHDKIDMGKIQRDAQEKSDREPAAKRKRERVEKALDQRTEQDKDIRTTTPTPTSTASTTRSPTLGGPPRRPRTRNRGKPRMSPRRTRPIRA